MFQFAAAPALRDPNNPVSENNQCIVPVEGMIKPKPGGGSHITHRIPLQEATKNGNGNFTSQYSTYIGEHCTVH